MNENWQYHEALAADRRAARRQLDLALTTHRHEPELVAPTPVYAPPPLPELVYYERDVRGGTVSNNSVSWMLVLLLMMSSVILTILLFVVLFVTGIIGGGAP